MSIGGWGPDPSVSPEECPLSVGPNERRASPTSAPSYTWQRNDAVKPLKSKPSVNRNDPFTDLEKKTDLKEVQSTEQNYDQR